MTSTNDEVNQLILQLRDSDWSVRLSAVEALGKIRDVRAVGPLIGVLLDQSSSMRNHFYWSITSVAAYALSTILPDWTKSEEARHHVPEFIASLHHENPLVRHMAGRVLGGIGDKRAFDPLIATLHDEEPFIRTSAAFALGEIGDVRAVEPIIALLQKSNGQPIAFTHPIFMALAQLRDVRAVAPLIARLRQPAIPPDTRPHGSIATALGLLGDAQAVGPLIDFTRPRNQERGIALQILLEISELILFFVPRSDSLIEGDKALRSILTANKPLLHSYPHLLCSRCRVGAKRHHDWSRFFHRVTYVTCQNCGSSLKLVSQPINYEEQ